MATRALHILPPALTFPAPGVAASIQRAITAARKTGDRQTHAARIETSRNLDGTGHRVPTGCLHVVRPETPRSTPRASARAEPA
jgi:hypothetical protein